MTSLEDLVTTFLGSRESLLPNIQAFPALDLEQLGRELNLDGRAEEAGRMGQPPSNASGPDLAELDNLSEIERRARKGSEDYRSQLDLYEGRIRRALITADHRARIETHEPWEARGCLLPAEVRRKIVCENAGRLYGFIR